mmetsp:Transcript_116093/g.361736  ORF Transcript_116093/g.361736 Transcript_116093/m.361736 type:complete len:203 (-) Transcript_116093:133-741(-)
MPPSQRAEQPDQPLQRLTTQFAGQPGSPHGRVSLSGGHSTPPTRAGAMTSRVEVRSPWPQETLHGPSSQSVTSQSSGNSVRLRRSQSWSLMFRRPQIWPWSSLRTLRSHRTRAFWYRRSRSSRRASCASSSRPTIPILLVARANCLERSSRLCALLRISPSSNCCSRRQSLTLFAPSSRARARPSAISPASSSTPSSNSGQV